MSAKEKRLKQYKSGLSANLEPWEFKSWLNEFLNLKREFKIERVNSININVKVPLENPLENIPNATYLWVKPSRSASMLNCYLINLNKELAKKVIEAYPGVSPTSNLAWEYYYFNIFGEKFKGDYNLKANDLKGELINTLTFISNEDIIQSINLGGGYNYIDYKIEIGDGNGYHFTWYMDKYHLYKITQDNQGFDFLNWTKDNPLEVKE